MAFSFLHGLSHWKTHHNKTHLHASFTTGAAAPQKLSPRKVPSFFQYDPPKRSWESRGPWCLEVNHHFKNGGSFWKMINLTIKNGGWTSRDPAMANESLESNKNTHESSGRQVCRGLISRRRIIESAWSLGSPGVFCLKRPLVPCVGPVALLDYKFEPPAEWCSFFIYVLKTRKHL